jgi:hypothetical protein
MCPASPDSGRIMPFCAPRTDRTGRDCSSAYRRISHAMRASRSHRAYRNTCALASRTGCRAGRSSPFAKLGQMSPIVRSPYGCLLYADISGAWGWERGSSGRRAGLGRRRMAGGAADSGTAGGGSVRRGGDGGTRMGGRGRERTKESAVMRGRVTGDERTERARDEGTGGGRRRRRWSLPANATRTRTRRRGGRRRRRAARFRRSAGSPCGG